MLPIMTAPKKYKTHLKISCVVQVLVDKGSKGSREG
jgi:hypothetical protein